MSKDVLEYSEEELNSLSVEELEFLLEEATSNEAMWNTRQLSEKLLMNSLYGALSNKYFLLFNEDIAAAITGNGRFFIKKLANYIEENLQGLFQRDKPYVVGGDTDSNYFSIEPFMEKYMESHPGLSLDEYVTWADTFEKKVIAPIVKKTIDDFAEQLNAHNKEVMGVDREAISDVSIFHSKKHYIARLRDNEGTRLPESDPKIKVVGLELVKSSTPKWSQKYLSEAIPHILDEDENDLLEYLRSIKKDFINADPNDIAIVGGVNNLSYTLGDKSIPIGSRASLIYNKFLKENDLEDRYGLIMPGDKVKKLFLTTPNKFGSDVIAFIDDRFVKEIDCIDYDKTFEKGFLNALQIMVSCLNYNTRRETEILEDW